MDARTEILGRIRAANVPSTTADRAPLRRPERLQAEIVAQFADYAAEYKASVIQCALDGVRRAVGELLGSERTVLPPGFPSEWLPIAAQTMVDSDFSPRELDAFDAVLTLAALGIAETGTLILDHGPGQGRRALTLVPDHHVVLIRASDIVDGVADAVERIGPAVRAGRPLTWISGPSATSDIELQRVEGVHGPRRLDIVIVE